MKTKLQRAGRWLLETRVLEKVYQVIVGTLLTYMGIAAFGDGSPAGMIGSFYGMLFWAIAERQVKVIERFYDQMSKLVDECMQGWKDSQKGNDDLLKVNGELLKLAPNFSPVPSDWKGSVKL